MIATATALAAQSPATAGQTFSQWVTENNLSGPAAAPLAAPAGDNVPNLLKFALGLEPNTPAPADRLPSGWLTSDGQRTFTYFERSTIEASLQVEASADLLEWKSDAVEEIARTPENGGSLVTVRETLPEAPDRAFLRLRVSLPGPPAPYSDDPLNPTPVEFLSGDNEVSGQVATPR
ncbi:MAG: hypothetical protein WEB31_04645, partial [Chthoniobacterales bacterium]